MGKGSGSCTESRPALTFAGGGADLTEPQESRGEKNGEIEIDKDHPAMLDVASKPLLYNSKVLNFELIDSQEKINSVVTALQHSQVKRIALDIETTGNSEWDGAIRLIQLGIEEPEPKQFLIDTWHIDPTAIMPFMQDDEYEIITCNGSYEQRWFYYHYGVEISKMYDVRYVAEGVSKAKNKPNNKHRFKDLMRRYLNKRISKTQQTSNWGRFHLSNFQLRYAAMDVAGLLDIRRQLQLDVAKYDPKETGLEKSALIAQSARSTMASSARENEAEFDKVFRAISFSKTLEELDLFASFLPRMHLSQRQRDKLGKIIKEKRSTYPELI